MCRKSISKSISMSPYKVLRSIDLLDDRLKPIVRQILADCKYHNLPFEVFETGRSLVRQEYLKEQGMSRTLRSKHLIKFGEDGKICKKSEAFDIVLRYKHNGKMTWSWAEVGDKEQRKKDLGLYKMMVEMVASRYKEVKQKGLITRLVLGGQWSSFKDRPHIELS